MPIPAIPVWGWAAGGAAALFIAMKMKGKNATATGQAQTTTPRSGNNGNAPSPSIFFLPQGVQNPNQITVNVPRYPDASPIGGTPRNNPHEGENHGSWPPPPGTPPPPPPSNNFGPFPVPQPAPPSLGYAPPSPGYVPPPAPVGPRARVRVSPWPGNAHNGLAGWDTTLWGIANHFGVSVSELVASNHISNPNLIHPGQEIVVP